MNKRPMASLFEAAGMERTRRGRLPTGCARETARRGGRAGPSARARRRADPHARVRLARLAHLLGAAGHRQDHRRPAARARETDLHFEQISAVFSGVADLKKVFEAARARREVGQGDAALRRRNPPLQPRPAGLLPAGDGGRHRHAGRRHDREPVLRAQRRAALARPRPRLQAARAEAALGKLLARAEEVEGQTAAARRRMRAPC